MSFLDDLLAQSKSLIDEAPEPTATDAIPHDRFDQAYWEEVRENVPAIDTDVTELSQKHDYVEDLYRDAFNWAVKGDPQFRAPDEMKPSHLPNREMLEDLTDVPEVKQLRSYTKNDQYTAAMALLSMKGPLRDVAERARKAREDAEELAKRQQEAREAAQAAYDAAQQAQQAQNAADQADDTDENGRSQSQEAADQAAQQAAAALAAAQQAAGTALTARESVQAAAQQAAAGTKAAMKAAASEAAQNAEEEAQLLAAFGVEDGELQQMSFPERQKLAQRLQNNRLAKFAKLIGQFRQLQAAESRRRVKHAPDEVNNIVLGDDLTRLAPAELINMATPELEDDFWLRYVQRQLLTYDLIGTERVGQGPIIVVCDESGSMGQALHGGTAEAWSKALALALCEQARMRGRDFHYIGFSSTGQQWHLKFEGGKAQLDKVIQMTEHFWGGGTHFEKPLLKALTIVEEDYEAKDLPKPDIVFMTDDEYGALDEKFMHRWNTVKDKVSLRCFGIALGCRVGGALQAVSDNVRSLDQLHSNPNEVADLFRTI